jgi:hypothetical protein
LIASIAAAVSTIPDAANTLNKADKTYKKAQRSPASQTKLQEFKELVQTARLALANQVFFALMGLGQLATGITGMLGKSVAEVFKYAPVLSTHAASVATAVCGAILGAVYTIRGTLILIKCSKTLHRINQFYEKFKGPANSDGNAETKIDAICREFTEYSARTGATDAKQARLNYKAAKRFGLEIQENPDVEYCGKNNKRKPIYTPFHAIGENQHNLVGKDHKAKLNQIKVIDKGIYTEKLKQKISIIIAVSMIIAGILTILLSTVLTAGLAPLIIGIISAAFFISVELVFVTQDSKGLFDKIRDKLYHIPKWLKELEEQLDSEQK